MLELDRHSLDGTVKDAGVVDVVPGEEETVSAFELLELFLPEASSILVQEVHECRVTRPSFYERFFTFLVANKDILGISFFPLRIL